MIQDEKAVEQHTSLLQDLPPVPPQNEAVLLQLIREMREQRLALQAEHHLAASERQVERRWKMFFQGVFFVAPLILGLLYFSFFLSSSGFRWGPFGDVVGVVRIDGQISSSSQSSADRIIPALEKAFANANVKAVILSIDSPGGAPVESERINNALASLKKKYDKPVVAVINNLGASAAYLIALHADKIVAGKYSLVGSIGAIMTPWELHRAIGSVKVTQRVYASGKMKSFLNPFTPVSPEMDAKAQKLVGQMGQTFVNELKAARGAALKPGVDYGSGEVWGGLEAKEIGLIDAIGTLDEVAQQSWGLKTYDFGPHQAGFGAFSAQTDASLLQLLEHFLAQQRFQLR